MNSAVTTTGADFNYDCTPRPMHSCAFWESHYTGKERDTESGLDYFGARYYASIVGRWMSPDWAQKVVAVPYANLDTPQSLNLYAYAENNPISQSDLDGHCDWCQRVLNFLTFKGWNTNAQLSGSPKTSVNTVQGEGIVRNAEQQEERDQKVLDLARSSPLVGLWTIADPMAWADGSAELLDEAVGEEEGVTQEIVVDSGKYPASARHIEDAQASGQPSVVTIDRAGSASRRAQALKGVRGVAGHDRDEYPPAFAQEGGSRASVRNIQRSDNRGSGASMGNQIRNLPDGTKVKIKTK
ncbi:MAG: hypothetical protein JSS87_02190 [Acidobacteria bacterium]|nr:hypothetical protein [Acidobacteriota bacterium]